MQWLAGVEVDCRERVLQLLGKGVHQEIKQCVGEACKYSGQMFGFDAFCVAGAKQFSNNDIYTSVK